VITISEIRTQAWEMRLEHLLAIEWGQVLLHSWIRFIAAGPDGTSGARVEYNTVGWAHVKRLLASVLARRLAASAYAEGPEGLALAGALPVKFRNAVRSHLFPWDRLLLVVHQPRELARRGWLPRGWRVRFPEAVLAVTSHHVLLLGEEQRLVSDDASWGTVATYLPLTCIQRAGVETSADEVRLRLAVGHGRAAWHVSTSWALGCREDLRDAVDRIERAIGRAGSPATQGCAFGLTHAT